MKKTILKTLMLIAVLLTSVNAFSHDFEAQNSDGVTIYYNITSASDLTVEVTYKGSSFSEYSNEYTGFVAIPTSVTYNNRTFKVTSIGRNAFYYCTNLISVTIPSSIERTYGYTFYDCTNLESVYISDLEAWCKIDFDICEGSNPLDYANNLYLNGKILTDIVIPNTITEVKYRTFSGYKGLTSVVIPNSVTSIGNGAFYKCSGLTSVTIGNGVTSIGSSAFSNCSSLTSVTIPNSVISIGNFAFNNCSSLTSVTIGNSVTSIGERAFQYCSSLTSVAISNSVTSIGKLAFDNCSSLISVTIPNSVTSIGSYAFNGCSGLETLTIGSGVKEIDEKAFNGCSSLSIINSLSTNPPSTTAFDARTQIEATLRIPKGSLAIYKAIDCWKDFWNIIEIVSTYNVNANYDANQGSVAINGVTETYAIVNVNDKIEFKITPVKGYEIDKVTVNNTDVTSDVVNGKYTIASATEDVTLEVTFKEQTFDLVLKCSEAGTFDKIMRPGEATSFRISPSSNWAICSVTFNGTDVTKELVDNVYTTPAITCDSELNVVFVDLETTVYSVYNTSDVVVSASQQIISIKGLEENTPVAIYSTNGQLYHSATAVDYEMNIQMNKNDVYLVKVGERTFKVIL